jgi:hypothetical protein
MCVIIDHPGPDRMETWKHGFETEVFVIATMTV